MLSSAKTCRRGQPRRLPSSLTLQQPGLGVFVGELAGGGREQEIGQDEQCRRHGHDDLGRDRGLRVAIRDQDDERVLEQIVVHRAENCTQKNGSRRRLARRRSWLPAIAAQARRPLVKSSAPSSARGSSHIADLGQRRPEPAAAAIIDYSRPSPMISASTLPSRQLRTQPRKTPLARLAHRPGAKAHALDPARDRQRHAAIALMRIRGSPGRRPGCRPAWRVILSPCRRARPAARSPSSSPRPPPALRRPSPAWPSRTASETSRPGMGESRWRDRSAGGFGRISAQQLGRARRQDLRVSDSRRRARAGIPGPCARRGTRACVPSITAGRDPRPAARTRSLHGAFCRN